MLEFDGLSVDDITLNNVEFNLLPTLISDQAVAVMGAYWTHETIIAEREGYPVDLMRVEEWGVPSYNELVLITSEETAATQPEMVTGVIAALKDGYLAAAADQSEALDILVSAYPETDRAVEEQGIAMLAELWTQKQPGFGMLNPDAWEQFAAWMITSGLIAEGAEIGNPISSLAMQTVDSATPAP
jgi:putative hydroxymethylpyrimidine transport system substrate-binding protein